MCGICGIVSLNGGPPPEVDLLTRMMGRLRHRGPDSSGYYRDKQASLGHTRLAIIDLETGAQPLSNEDETVWITFNGEIFNYVELTTELSNRGHVFRTASNNGCSGVDLSKMGGDFIGDISFLEMFEESADAVL